MAKEGLPRSQENTPKITFETIIWDSSTSERNKQIVKGLLNIGKPTSKRFIMPGTKEQPVRVQPPTKHIVDGAEVFFNPLLNFYQVHVDGVDAYPVPFKEEDSAQSILHKIRTEVFVLNNHPKKKPKA